MKKKYKKKYRRKFPKYDNNGFPVVYRKSDKTPSKNPDMPDVY